MSATKTHVLKHLAADIVSMRSAPEEIGGLHAELDIIDKERDAVTRAITLTQSLEKGMETPSLEAEVPHSPER